MSFYAKSPYISESLFVHCNLKQSTNKKKREPNIAVAVFSFLQGTFNLVKILPSGCFHLNKCFIEEIINKCVLDNEFSRITDFTRNISVLTTSFDRKMS